MTADSFKSHRARIYGERRTFFAEGDSYRPTARNFNVFANLGCEISYYTLRKDHSAEIRSADKAKQIEATRNRTRHSALQDSFCRSSCTAMVEGVLWRACTNKSPPR